MRTKEKSLVKKVIYRLQSFALLYMGLEDKTQAFGDFLDTMGDKKSVDCYELFPNCGIPDDYFY